ncbi:MAG: pyrroline-5-carboxylate reductase [Eubacteriales bacterium]|nr:pyrroline-5-carboxylate reductase [Eubacteriales bacterium]
MTTIGFIGTGKMGGALATAVSKNSAFRLLLANRHPEKAIALSETTGGEVADVSAVAERADYIFLGVKPQMLSGLLKDIKDILANRENPLTLVTMAAGTEIRVILDQLGKDYPVIRIMPNIPVAIGQGLILYSCNQLVNKKTLDEFLDAMSFSGRLLRVDERMIDAGSAVSGCGPAYAALFIEALADGGVACGLPRNQAVECAAQMVLGTAQYILSTGTHPGELKDAVCSPGGTTIQGVRALEEGGFRGSVMDAVISSYEKTLSLK